MKLSLAQIKAIIQEKGLLPASQRTYSLFLISCVSIAYIKLLHKSIGIQYNGVAAIGNKNGFRTLMNEAHIAGEMGRILQNNKNNFQEKFFQPAERVFEETEKKVKYAQTIMNKDPFLALEIISEEYPEYLGALAIYNALWRCIGNRKSTDFLSEKDIEKFAKLRAQKAELYPKIEELATLCAKKIGEKIKFDGALLLLMTVSELRDFLTKRNISEKTKNVLRKRSQGYFYLFADNKESIFTDKKVLDYIEKTFYSISAEVKEIKGYPAFKGKVTGLVQNIAQGSRTSPSIDFILVAPMTHPNEMPLIKKCKAIVTDEGGVLCHAAIIARELKKPCIIGTKIATKILKDGDLVEVDAEKGMVKIIKRK